MDCRIFCIIVTYNAMKWVDRCFCSLFQSSLPVSLVVIDNNSKDETVEYIRSHYPEIHIIKNKENRGFGQANNQGIEYAYKQGATHFFLLNQDAWLHNGSTLKRLVTIQEQYQLSIVSPIHLNGSGTLMDNMFFKYVVSNEHNNKFVSGLLLGNFADCYDVLFVNAAAWLISRQTIETIGGFNPLFFHYGEDVNYLHRLKYNHGKLAIATCCFIHHDRDQHGNTQMYKKRQYARKLLLEYANVNKPMLSLDSARTKFLLVYVRETAFALLSFHILRFFSLISDYCVFLSNIGNIRKSRRKDRQIGSNWINI